MHLSQSNIDLLREQVEQKGGFHLAIAPMFPQLFPNVLILAESLYVELNDTGYSVLLDDRNQRPRNMFEVISFLDIPHRVVISSRSLSAGVVEYRNLHTNAFEKIEIDQAVQVLSAYITR
ncbi:MAG: hypothetical protein KAG28_10650 [Cocleimonas sp.]|nr:hypothetical protein [Cocleimonas sp.]